MFCGHEGWFLGDVFVTPFAITVISYLRESVGGDMLKRHDLHTAEWKIADTAGGYWGAHRGVFVLPREAVTRYEKKPTK